MIAAPLKREPREVVVDHGDGTVSPLMEARFLDVIDGIVRGRRAGDVVRKRMSASESQFAQICADAYRQAGLNRPLRGL